MPKLLGIVGALVTCAGLDLLWQGRHEIRFWVLAYLGVFRAMLRQEQPLRSFPREGRRTRRHGAVRFLLGMGFAFLLGPMLIALSLTLMLHGNF
ncbi:MAG TPA: hypothetical protein VEJ67_06190 [Candidatus Cybelea sp.]|nr:hypothetical protein [Candidatus Cybelea sp.]